MLAAVSPSTEDPSAGSPADHRLPPIIETIEALSADYIGSSGSRSHSTIPGFTRSIGAHHPYRSSDLEPCVQPIIDEPTNYGAMQETVQLSNVERLDTNVTQAKKHTHDDKEHLHLRIPPDALVPRSITTYSPFLPLLRSRQDCLLPTASPFDVVTSTLWRDKRYWFLLNACVVSALSPKISPAPRAT